jgi:hypothetical protein
VLSDADADYPDIDGPVGPRGNVKPKEEPPLPGVVAHPGHAVADADDDQSSFFSYFVLLCIVALILYLVFHNKQKVRDICVRDQCRRRISVGLPVL